MAVPKFIPADIRSWSKRGHRTVENPAGKGTLASLRDLWVESHPQVALGSPQTHLVRIHLPHHASVHFSYPSLMDPASASISGSDIHPDDRLAPPPSPELRALIETFHDGHHWMPLLDKLTEEYPQMLPGVNRYVESVVKHS